jgi:hypothetical protein
MKVHFGSKGFGLVWIQGRKVFVHKNHCCKHVFAGDEIEVFRIDERAEKPEASLCICRQCAQFVAEIGIDGEWHSWIGGRGLVEAITRDLNSHGKWYESNVMDAIAGTGIDKEVKIMGLRVRGLDGKVAWEREVPNPARMTYPVMSPELRIVAKEIWEKIRGRRETNDSWWAGFVFVEGK